MSEKRFIVESVMIDCLCEDEPRIAKVITDTDENYSYEDLYGVAELLNEQQATITALKEENEQLSKQMNRLYNYFQDWSENIMAGEHFSEMWDIVKEDESWDDE